MYAHKEMNLCTDTYIYIYVDICMYVHTYIYICAYVHKYM